MYSMDLNKGQQEKKKKRRVLSCNECTMKHVSPVSVQCMKLWRGQKHICDDTDGAVNIVFNYINYNNNCLGTNIDPPVSSKQKIDRHLVGV